MWPPKIALSAADKSDAYDFIDAQQPTLREQCGKFISSLKSQSAADCRLATRFAVDLARDLAVAGQLSNSTAVRVALAALEVTKQTQSNPAALLIHRDAFWSVFNGQTCDGMTIARLVSEGGSATPTSYTTTFAAAEQPLSESGVWKNGQTVGLQWTDVKSTIGYAGPSTGNMIDAEDSLAVLDSTKFNISADQEVVVTISKTGPTIDSAEVELGLRWGMSANNAPGYEILIPHAGNPQFIRQNGPYGSYAILTETSLGTWQSVAHGDQLRAKIVGTVITLYQKRGAAAEVATTTYDTAGDGIKHSTGMPAMGFYRTNGGVISNYGISSWIGRNAT